jgi:hypothetical protein
MRDIHWKINDTSHDETVPNPIPYTPAYANCTLKKKPSVLWAYCKFPKCSENRKKNVDRDLLEQHSPLKIPSLPGRVSLTKPKPPNGRA